MAILSFQEIMDAQDVTEQEVPVEEWGGSVVVRSISHRTMMDIKRGMDDEDDDADNEDEIQKWILVKGLVNPKVDYEQANLLFDKNTSAVMKVVSAILGKSKVEEKAVTKSEKQFPAESGEVSAVSPSGENASDSAGTSDGESTSA